MFYIMFVKVIIIDLLNLMDCLIMFTIIYFQHYWTGKSQVHIN